MHVLPTEMETNSRPSRFIAEALVSRHSPRQITARASALGLSGQLTKVIVTACMATATEPVPSRYRKLAAAN